jgi:anti-anti-sigma regulatory factor
LKLFVSTHPPPFAPHREGWSGVSSIDTSGLASVLEAGRIAHQQGTRLVLHVLNGQPRHLLSFSQIDHLLDIVEPETNGRQDPRR